jgi:hypothetical protein
MTCYCGAMDCPSCSPQAFRQGVYIGDCESEEEADELIEQEQEDRAEMVREQREYFRDLY